MTGILTQKRIISVSGGASGIGKTLLCEHILSVMPGIVAVKVTITADVRSVTDADADILTEGKDTCRLKAQGAAHVIWIQSPESCLPDMLQAAAKRVSAGARTVLIEGNSIHGCLSPDLSFFICDPGLRSLSDLKPSRKLALAQAHVVILNARAPLAAEHPSVTALCRSANPRARILQINLGNRPAVLRAIEPILRSLPPEPQVH